MSVNFKQRLNTITTFIFDVDGVLTDSSVTLMPNGEQVRKMNIKDGYALQLAVKKGYEVVIISGGKSEAVRLRLQGLGINNIHLGIQNKLEIFDELILTNQLSPEQIMYMGDDIPDYEVMCKVGAAVCPADAAPEIQGICTYISQRKGGEGCVRDVIEQTLRVQGKWFDTEGFIW